MDSTRHQTTSYPSLLPMMSTIIPVNADTTDASGAHLIHTMMPPINNTHLHDRIITRSPITPHYNTCSPVVSQLLQKQQSLMQKLWSVHGINTFILFTGQMPQLINRLSSGKILGTVPFNLLHSTKKPSGPEHSTLFNHYITQHLNVLQTADSILRPYQPLLSLYEQTLKQQLTINRSELLFQGHHIQDKVSASVSAYPITDLVNYSYWLNATSDYAWQLIRKYMNTPSTLWPNQTQGYLTTPSPELSAPVTTTPKELKRQQTQLQQQTHWPSLIKYLGPFGHPLDKRATHNQRTESTAAESAYPSEPIEDDSEMGADIRLAQTTALACENSTNNMTPDNNSSSDSLSEIQREKIIPASATDASTSRQSPAYEQQNTLQNTSDSDQTPNKIHYASSDNSGQQFNVLINQAHIQLARYNQLFEKINTHHGYAITLAEKETNKIQHIVNNLTTQLERVISEINKVNQEKAITLLSTGKACFVDYQIQHKLRIQKKSDSLKKIKKELDHLERKKHLAIKGNNTRELNVIICELAELNRKFSQLILTIPFDSEEAKAGLNEASHYILSSHYLPKQTNQAQKNHPIHNAIECLKKTGNKRRILHDFFDSTEAKILAGENIDHRMQNPEDPQLIELFISEYRKAIELETKQTPEKWSGAHQNKKHKRLQAIDQIEAFIKRQNPNAPQYSKHCQLAYQALIRVREPGFVHQRHTPVCGGFAILQHAWRENPNIVTKLLLEIHTKGHTTVTAQNGANVKLVLQDSPSMPEEEAEEALADKLLIYALYPPHSCAEGSDYTQDAYKSFFLGLQPLMLDEQKKADSTPESLLNTLQTASQHNLCFSIGISQALTDPLFEKITNSALRKEQKNNYEVISVDGEGPTSHRVLLDEFSYDKTHVYFKVYSWGQLKRYRMKKDSFINNIYPLRLIFFAKQKNIPQGFSPPPSETALGTQDGRAIYMDCMGHYEFFDKGQLLKGAIEGTGYYLNKEGTIDVYASDEQFKILWLSNNSEIVAWKKNDKSDTQTLPLLTGDGRVTVNKDGAVVGYDQLKTRR